MAYYQILDAPAGTYQYKPNFFEANVVPALNTLSEMKRKKAIEAAISSGDFDPEYTIGKDGEYSVKYSKKKPVPETEDSEQALGPLEQIVNKEDVIRGINERKLAGDPMSLILSQLDEASRSVIGLPGRSPLPRDEIMQMQDEIDFGKEGAAPVSVSPRFKEGKGLSAFFSKDVANIPRETKAVLGKIKTLDDLANLLSDKDALRGRIDFDAVREYFGEGVFSAALERARRLR